MVKKFDKTILATRTCGNIIAIANELARNMSPTRKEQCSVIRELEILNKDHKKAMETIANINKKRRRGKKV